MLNLFIFNFKKKDLFSDIGGWGIFSFCLKMILLMGGCALLLYILSLGYKKVNCDDSSYTKKFQDMPERIEISNLGNSHGLFGFCYDEQEKEKAFNFGLVSQSLDYDYRLIQQYQDRLAEGGVMFIVVSYFSLCEKEETEEDNFLSKNRRYYGILSPKYVKNYSFKEDLLADIFPVMGTKDNVIYEIATSREREITAKDVWNRTLSETSREDIQQDAESSYLRHTEQLFDENEALVFNERNVTALYGIIALCREKNIEPVIVTTPYLREYVEEFYAKAPRYLENFYEFMRKVERETGAAYLDYSCDVRFEQEYQYFWSVDHLNRAGAVEFTKLVLEESGRK